MNPTEPTNAMYRVRLTPSLLAELFELEEDAYRLALREAKRIGCGPPAAALRAVVAHANEALEELPVKARSRHVRLGSVGALAVDTFHRVRDIVLDQLVDHEHGYRRALTALRRGIDLAHLTHAAAIEEGDDELAKWCSGWLRGRERLVLDAAEQLEWFARHPFFSRLPGTPLLSI